MTLEIILDFEGIDVFWRIMESYQAGTEPESKVWDRLFETAGYSALTKSEFSKDMLEQAIALAFRRGRSDQGEPSPNASLRNMAEHFREAGNRHLEIESILEKWKGRVDVLSRTVSDRAEEYLPVGGLVDRARVAFAFFARDARGYDSIIVDGLLAAELGNLLVLLIAHEYHHQCRDALLCFDKDEIENQDEDLMWVINQVQAEGIADHIDKPRWFLGENPVKGYSGFIQRYREEIQNTEATIELMDKVIEKGYLAGETHGQIGMRVREILPLSGHPTGYFMSNLVSEAGLSTEMIQSIGNPFEFFRLYNKAAEILERRAFSKSSQTLLDKLERRYCRS